VLGGVLQGVQIWQESDVWMPRWREIENTRKEALEGWLALGCADESSLSALVNPDGVLEVFCLPREMEPVLQLDTEGNLHLPYGIADAHPLDLLGRRMVLPLMEAEQVVKGLRWTQEGLEIVDS
jgi:hypothetical protein